MTCVLLKCSSTVQQHRGDGWGEKQCMMYDDPAQGAEAGLARYRTGIIVVAELGGRGRKRPEDWTGKGGGGRGRGQSGTRESHEMSGRR